MGILDTAKLVLARIPTLGCIEQFNRLHLSCEIQALLLINAGLSITARAQSTNVGFKIGLRRELRSIRPSRGVVDKQLTEVQLTRLAYKCVADTALL